MSNKIKYRIIKHLNSLELIKWIDRNFKRGEYQLIADYFNNYGIHTNAWQYLTSQCMDDDGREKVEAILEEITIPFSIEQEEFLAANFPFLLVGIDKNRDVSITVRTILVMTFLEKHPTNKSFAAFFAVKGISNAAVQILVDYYHSHQNTTSRLIEDIFELLAQFPETDSLRLKNLDAWKIVARTAIRNYSKLIEIFQKNKLLHFPAEIEPLLVEEHDISRQYIEDYVKTYGITRASMLPFVHYFHCLNNNKNIPVMMEKLLIYEATEEEEKELAAMDINYLLRLWCKVGHVSFWGMSILLEKCNNEFWEMVAQKQNAMSAKMLEDLYLYYPEDVILRYLDIMVSKTTVERPFSGLEDSRVVRKKFLARTDCPEAQKLFVELYPQSFWEKVKEKFGW